MMKAIVCIGVSGTGKTTWAKQFIADQTDSDENWSIVCRDDERAKLSPGGELDWKSWNWKRENEVSNAHCESLKAAARAGKNVIIADTNLNKRFLDELVTRLKSLGYTDISFKVFELDTEEAIQRDLGRGPKLSVGADVIKRQLDAFNNLKKLNTF
jgi:predicted kinase